MDPGKGTFTNLGSNAGISSPAKRRFSRSMVKMSRQIIAAFALMLPLAGGAAATEITVVADQARMISVPGETGTVVVGNPNIADVTMQGNNVFVHGRNYGTTNVIFIDRDGNQLASLDVMVTNGASREINVFRAGSRFSYSCAGTCEAATQIGDNSDYFKAVAEQNTAKGALATGSQKASE
jgi:Flp pilus assembly secretin CpaC